MARSNPLGDTFELARRIPVWLSVVLAGLLYFMVPRLYAAFSAGFDEPLTQALFDGFQIFVTLILQYTIPAILLLGAFASVIDRARQGALLKRARHAPSEADPFASISWRQFEQLCAAYFREKDYFVIETQGGADGGVDLKLLKGTQVFYVQCKHWRARKVPVQMVRELFGVIAAKGAAGGYIVASGAFTKEAERFAQSTQIKLVRGQDVLKTRPEQPPHDINLPVSPVQATPAASLPQITCPDCQSPMVVRTATRGNYAGRQFYGCTAYPRCKSIINLHEDLAT